MASKVAVVTGSVKGLGYAIVKELCKRGVGVVYLTSEDVNKGQEAFSNLKKEGLNPWFHELDVTNNASVKALADHLKVKHEGLDILINNAGVAPQDFNVTTYEDSKRVIDVNYRSILTIQEHFHPLLKDNARVINISSDCGHINNLKNSLWIERLTKKDAKLEDVDAFVDWFLDSLKNETLNTDDFTHTNILAYRISKIALSALTRIQQNNVGRGISVNCVHPGYIRTDMTRGTGLMTADEACKTPVYLALDADQSLKGKYIWYDKSEKDWTDPNLKLFTEEDLATLRQEFNKLLQSYMKN